MACYGAEEVARDEKGRRRADGGSNGAVAQRGATSQHGGDGVERVGASWAQKRRGCGKSAARRATPRR
ncbi:uncharacterized protein K452DRAFT_282495 [Aplosporella prunicola CBS 121167]|uniref:Uncharacterized protein n=1 Tax=Aplosporella prunicola CBS 121167 TaxID=1176127 RepID=A0A6A6BW12_9PEZI|nr:uncharacterized protein K452DRAFT_282495 [Aplosporella prunicola CBS 121167]KAF2147485.1 hypothetical protein K452DRAFT_282495 [Aplosporella prunicola CBS 121167]